VHEGRVVTETVARGDGPASAAAVDCQSSPLRSHGPVTSLQMNSAVSNTDSAQSPLQQRESSTVCVVAVSSHAVVLILQVKYDVKKNSLKWRRDNYEHI